MVTWYLCALLLGLGPRARTSQELNFKFNSWNWQRIILTHKTRENIFMGNLILSSNQLIWQRIFLSFSMVCSYIQIIVKYPLNRHGYQFLSNISALINFLALKSLRIGAVVWRRSEKKIWSIRYFFSQTDTFPQWWDLHLHILM